MDIKPAPTAIAPEQIEELEEKHGGDLLVLSTPFGDAAFRAAALPEWQRFTDEASDPASRGVAMRNLVNACCVAPERALFERMIARRPGLVQSFGNELIEFCGVIRVEVRKK
jgi:hypothetical protein